jgi:hypothetical protein
MERLANLTRDITGQPVGHEFLKSAWLKARHPGDPMGAALEAKRFALTAPTLEAVLQKAAVAAGDTTTSGWSSELASYFSLAREWVIKVSTKTVLGRLAYTRAAFLTRTLVSADAAIAGYVGQGRAIPVRKALLASTTTLDRLKAAVIAAVTNELLGSWSPGTQAQLDDTLTRAIVLGLDRALLDPDVAAVVGENPASLLNGVSPLGDFTNTAAGALADIEALLRAHVDAGSDLDRVLIAMHPTTCLTLSLMQNANGNSTFPALTATGGFIVGVPVATTVSAVRSGSPNEKLVAAINGARVLVADDGEVLVDASENTILELSDSPTGDATGTPQPVSMVSMAQTNTTAIRLRRYVNFQRADSSAVSWMTSNF